MIPLIQFRGLFGSLFSCIYICMYINTIINVFMHFACFFLSYDYHVFLEYALWSLLVTIIESFFIIYSKRLGIKKSMKIFVLHHWYELEISARFWPMTKISATTVRYNTVSKEAEDGVNSLFIRLLVWFILNVDSYLVKNLKWWWGIKSAR